MEKKVVILGSALAVTHGLAVLDTWYWIYPWFDIPMHFLGGVFVAAFFLWLIQKYPEQFGLPRNFFVEVVIFLSFTALIGVLWEFAEFTFDLATLQMGFGQVAGGDVVDTLGDLFFDLLGGLTVVALNRLSYNKSEQKNG